MAQVTDHCEVRNNQKETKMAICFDLEISFLDVEFDFEDFSTRLAHRVKPFKKIAFHPLKNTFITVDGPYQGQLSVTPKNVGMGVSLDEGGCEHDIDDDEALKLSLHMYGFIKSLPDFQMALVGWELGFLSNYLIFNKTGEVIDVAEVEGLVVSNELLEKVNDKSSWVEFDTKHQWIPCESQIGNIFGDEEDD